MSDQMLALNTALRVLGVIFLLSALSVLGVPFDKEPWLFVGGVVFAVCIIGVTDQWLHEAIAELRRRKR